MKKLFLLLSFASGPLYATASHTHKITVAFEFEVSPNSTKEWEDIKAHFDPFLKSAEQNNMSELMHNLEQAIIDVPNHCRTNKIRGSCNINLSCNTPDDK